MAQDSIAAKMAQRKSDPCVVKSAFATVGLTFKASLAAEAALIAKAKKGRRTEEAESDGDMIEVFWTMESRCRQEYVRLRRDGWRRKKEMQRRSANSVICLFGELNSYRFSIIERSFCSFTDVIAEEAVSRFCPKKANVGYE